MTTGLLIALLSQIHCSQFLGGPKGPFIKTSTYCVKKVTEKIKKNCKKDMIIEECLKKWGEQ